MANLDRIVNVQIALQTTAIQQQSFSDMLIYGPHVHGLGRTMIITSTNDLLALGMSPTNPIYLAAADAFSQIPSVKQVFIGRQNVADYSLAVPAVVVVGNVFSFVLSYILAGATTSKTITFTAAATTGSSVITGLIAAIVTSGVPFTGTAVGAALKITPTTAGQAFSITGQTANLTYSAATVTETAAVALAAIRAENDTWYGLIATSRVPADILAVAAWTEANNKLFGTAVAEPGAIDPASTTDTLYLLKAGNFFRTYAFYHAGAATDFVDAAIMSRKFTQYPGSETWANTKLGGITTDALLETAAQAVFAKNGDTFEPFRNITITQNGKVAGGEWIDVIRFRDWLVEQIKINVFSLLVNNEKIPYTDQGIRQVKSMLQQALDLGVTRGGIAPEELDDDGKAVRSYVITVPLNADVPFNDKANRVLNDVKFSARLAGAIHVVNMTGVLTYNDL